MATTRALLVTCALTAGCLSDTDNFGPSSGRYTRSELDAKVAELEARVGLLDACGEGDVLVRAAGGWTCAAEPPCPTGFARAEQDTVAVCTRVVGTAADVMVKVGDFWIDRYELSACPGGNLGAATGEDTTAAACSTTDVLPQVNITWFQAAALCSNAGKRLCSNAEWQTAVSGTVDPGAAPGTAGECVTQASSPRRTGLGSQCRSRFGAEDMIGNVWEWVADWHVGGREWQTVDGENPAPRSGVGVGPWPPGYHDDQTWNLDGISVDAIWQRGLPGAAIRGGAWTSATEAGAFTLALSSSPPRQVSSIGARCCVGRQ